MNISIKEEKGKTVIALDGWLDTETASQLGDALAGLSKEEHELILDFAKLEYISSAGIRQLVAAHKSVNGNLVIINVSTEVMEVLNMTGVSKRISISQG